MSELLPTPYYHLVLPCHELNPLIIRNRKALFKLLLMPLPKPLSIMAGCPLSVPIAEYDTHLGTATQFSSHVHCIVTEVVLMGKKCKPNA
jgi:hypothetical protein